jgi:membrane protein required for beta-lactamase induction
MDFGTEGEASEVLLHWLGTDGTWQVRDFGRLGVLLIDKPAANQNADMVRWSPGAALAFTFGASAILWAAIYLLFTILTAH